MRVLSMVTLVTLTSMHPAFASMAIGGDPPVPATSPLTSGTAAHGNAATRDAMRSVAATTRQSQTGSAHEETAPTALRLHPHPTSAAGRLGPNGADPGHAGGSSPADDHLPREDVTGRVVDADGRPLSGAVIAVAGTTRTALSDRNGVFRITGLPPGPHTLEVRAIGYRPTSLSVTLPAAAALTIALESAPIDLPGVVATASPIRGTAAYQATQVLQAEQLHRLSGPSVGALLDGQPGVSARYFGAAPARPVIRGFDGERVVVLENGERMGDTQERAPDDAVSLDPLAIDRIEVVRGPASLLYGSGSLGGVVNLFTRDIPESWSPGLSGDLALEGASVNTMMGGSARVVYGGDRWGVTGRASARSGQNTQTPAGVMPNSHLQTTSAAVGTGYQSARLRLGVATTFHAQEYGIPEFAVRADDGGARFTEVEPEASVIIERVSVQSRGEWSPGGWLRAVEFRTNFSNSQQEEGEEEEEEEEEVEQEIHTRLFATTVIFRHSPFAFFDPGAFGVNLRLQNQQIEGIEAYHPGERLLSLAGFFFQEIPIRPDVRLQLGGRIENERSQTVANTLFPPETTSRTAKLNLAGSIGVNVRPSDRLEIGAQLARAHRNPTVVERYASGWDVGAGRVEIGDPDLRSEVGHGVDLFGRVSSDRVRVELAAFGYRIGDYVTIRSLPPGCGGIPYRARPDRDFPPCVQYYSADAEMLGGEALVEAMVTNTVRVRSTLDYVRGTRTDGAGEPLAFVPPLRATIGAMHDTGSWFAGATSRVVAAQDRVPPGELPTSGYSLLNLEAGLRFRSGGRHVLSLRLDNALDSSYFEHLSVIRRFPEPVSPENPVRFEMPGRNLNLAYRLTF